MLEFCEGAQAPLYTPHPHNFLVLKYLTPPLAAFLGVFSGNIQPKNFVQIAWVVLEARGEVQTLTQSPGGLVTGCHFANCRKS